MRINIQDVVLTILSGLLLALAFSSYNIGAIAWVAFLPVFYALKDKAGFSPFLIGLIWGVSFFSGALYWISYAAVIYGHIPWILGALVTLLLAFVLSLYTAIFFQWVSCFFKKAGFVLLFGLPAVWVFLEFLRGRLFTGFPWASLGYSQHKFITLIQIADVTGIYGLSFLVMMVNTRLFIFFQRLKKEGVPYKETAVVVLLLGCSIIYGRYRMTDIEDNLKGWETLKVGIVQGNIDQAQKWDPGYREKTVRIYKELSETGFEDADRVELMVWPETATPFYIQSDRRYLPVINNMVREQSFYLLTGSPAYREKDGDYEYFNSAFLFSPEDKEVGRYDKVHLVPFGEYVPMKRFLPFVRKMVDGVGDFSPGREVMNLSIPESKFGVLICYEVIFPDLVRKFVNKGAGFLVNITNDAWYGKTSAPFQHLAQAAIRSVENRVYLVRAANTGISAFVDPLGRVISQSGLFTREVMKGEIRINSNGSKTFYTKYGDLFA
ncbi:MAG: apolipoprotein N-acyltransferase, partial [Thermodesulfobacteriota bacterium]